MDNVFEFKKKIVFFGMPDMATTELSFLKRANVNVVGVVCPPENNITSAMMQAYAKNLGYEIIVPKENVCEQEVVDKIRSFEADLGVVASYTQKFSPELLSSMKDGVINLHPSLLPEYRGPNPYAQVILNGEKETGVTIHKMDENFDTGNILCQKVVPVTNNETMGTLFNKLNSIAGELMLQYLVVYEKEGMTEGLSQADAQPKHYAAKIVQNSADTVIDWSQSAVDIERKIRALNPFYSVVTSFQGVQLKIYTAESADVQAKYEPGTICALGDTIDVATGNGILKIRSLQLGSFLIGDARDLIERVGVSVGMRLM